MTDFTFNELLDRRDVDLHTSRIIRHDWHGLESWRHSRVRFEHFVSYQRTGSNTPYRGAEIVFQFVPTGSTGALFVGAHKILDEWPSPPEFRQPRLYDPTTEHDEDDWEHLRYDLALRTLRRPRWQGPD